MLERPALLIGPFRAGPHGRYRSVRDAVTQAVLGHAFRSGRFGLGWFTPRVESVHEEPDGSLLTVARAPRWLGMSLVIDADENVVAVIRRRQIEWPDGRVMAEITHLGRGRGEFRAAAGVEWAHWLMQTDSVLLSFHPRSAAEPLMKMAMLGTVLLRC